MEATKLGVDEQDIAQADEIQTEKWSRRSLDAHLYKTIGWIARRWL